MTADGSAGADHEPPAKSFLELVPRRNLRRALFLLVVLVVVVVFQRRSGPFFSRAATLLAPVPATPSSQSPRPAPAQERVPPTVRLAPAPPPPRAISPERLDATGAGIQGAAPAPATRRSP